MKRKKKEKHKRKKVDLKNVYYTSEQAVATAISMIRTIAQAFDVNIAGVVERGSYKAAFAPMTAMKPNNTQKHLLRTGRLMVKFSKRGKLPILVDYYY